jgi:hypothetical protein
MGGDLSSGGCDEFGTWLKYKVVSRRTREMAVQQGLFMAVYWACSLL